MMGGDWGSAMGAAGSLWMVVGLALTVGLVVLAVWAAVRVSSTGGTLGTAGASALDILRERFARGELTAEEFEQAKRTLGQR